PRAKMAKLVSAPPENSWRNPSTPPEDSAWFLSSCTASMRMPGAGTYHPNLYRAMTANVNRILFRRSVTLNMFHKLDNTSLSPLQRRGRQRRRAPLVRGG